MLLRALVGLEDGGGNEFFGEPQFQISDLLRTAPDGRGVISCLELPAVQERPKLFSTALMWLLAELFEALPEVGDVDKPKLVFFFDEAHLLFDGATQAFVDSVAQTVRLIRSKGVGVFFITQTPKDIPGRRARPARQPHPARAARVHARRREGAARDRQDLPEVRRSTTSGRCSPRWASARPPSRSSPSGRADAGRAHAARSARARAWVRPTTSTRAAKASPLYAKYGTRVDNQSARELLAARMAPPAAAPAPAGTPAEAGRRAHAERAAQGGSGCCRRRRSRRWASS